MPVSQCVAGGVGELVNHESWRDASRGCDSEAGTGGYGGGGHNILARRAVAVEFHWAKSDWFLEAREENRHDLAGV